MLRKQEAPETCFQKGLTTAALGIAGAPSVISSVASVLSR